MTQNKKENSKILKIFIYHIINRQFQSSHYVTPVEKTERNYPYLYYSRIFRKFQDSVYQRAEKRSVVLLRRQLYHSYKLSVLLSSKIFSFPS